MSRPGNDMVAHSAHRRFTGNDDTLLAGSRAILFTCIICMSLNASLEREAGQDCGRARLPVPSGSFTGA